MSDIEVVELDKEEAAAALALTKLDIMVASIEGDQAGLFAAHGDDHSFMVLCGVGDIAVWCMQGGTKYERKTMTATVREMLVKEYGTTTTD